MNPKKALFPSTRGLWELLWRSMVLLPVAVALMILHCAFWAAVFLLPVVAVVFAIQSLWQWAMVCLMVWIPLLLLTRWRRVHVDSKDALNAHENV